MKTILGRIALLITAFVPVLPGLAQPITIKTSDTLLGLSQKWADVYMAKHADTRLEVTGGGAIAAFGALAEKKINIATVSRAMRFKEAQACEAAFGQRHVEFKVGVNGVAVYVNADNPVKVLTYDELAGVFLGKRKNWKELGGSDAAIVVYGVETNTPAGELFAEEVLNGKPLASEVRLMTGADLMKAIGRDANAIAFGPLAQAQGVRGLNIKRAFSSTPVEPTEETISNRIYPISRFLYCYVDPAANKGEIKAYLDWIRSDEGQQVAKQAGYYPLPAKWRATQ